MSRLRLSKNLAAIAALLCAIALGTNLGFAQQSDPLTINGTLIMESGETDTWTLTLHGLSHDNYYEVLSDAPNDFYARYSTRVNATSFDFEFQGPDADELNAIFSPQLEMGVLFFEVRQVIATDYDWGGLTEYGDWWIEINPSEIVTTPGIHFGAAPAGLEGPFAVDANGYPFIEPRVSYGAWVWIFDDGPGNSGYLGQGLGNVVAFDAPLPPPPPPPPPPPILSIADASVREGNKGTTRLDLAVTLSASTTDTVTVHFATADGTAQKKSDYTATSGTLIIPAGQTQGTISVAIKGDRKREKDETFFVQLSGPAGVTVLKGYALVTILNDD